MDHVQIAVDTANGITIVRLGGKVIGDAVPEFESILREQARSQATRLILDLGEVELLDSTALGVIIACYTTLTRRGAKFALARVPDNIRDVLEATRLITILEIIPDAHATQ